MQGRRLESVRVWGMIYNNRNTKASLRRWHLRLEGDEAVNLWSRKTYSRNRGSQLIVSYSLNRYRENSKIRQCIEQGIQNLAKRFWKNSDPGASPDMWNKNLCRWGLSICIFKTLRRRLVCSNRMRICALKKRSTTPADDLGSEHSSNSVFHKAKLNLHSCLPRTLDHSTFLLFLGSLTVQLRFQFF